MKKYTLLALLISLINMPFVLAADTTAPISAEDQKQLEAYGWIMGKQLVEGSSAQFGFTDAETKIVISGVQKGMLKQGNSPIVEEKDGDALETYLENKAKSKLELAKAELEKTSAANKSTSKQFFANLEKNNANKAIKKTASGLYYEIKKQGSTEMPTENSNIKVHYVGTLIDGTEFDSSKKRGEPATFNLNGVIPGFREGLQLIGKGGTIRLYVPSDLAYGDQDIPGIPAGSALIFDVDMLDIIKTEN